MISAKHSAFGLDLSDLSIKLVWLEKTGRQIKLVSSGRQEIPDGVIESGVIKKEDELISLIKKTINEAKGQKIKTKYCVVSLPETESYIRVVQLPKMKTEEIAEAIRWELEANIPVAINDLYFDWQIINRNSDSGGQLDILIGALPKVLIDPYLSVIRKAGLSPVVFEIESVATARALVKNEISREPLIIIDIGARKTSLIIFSGDIVWFTTGLAVSNSGLIDEIARNLKVDKERAKKIKFEVGLEAEEKQAKSAKAMEPKLLELVAEINKYIEYYKTAKQTKRSPAQDISKVILCGGGASLKGLAGFLSSRLKIETVIGNPWVNILNESSRDLPDIPFDESLAYTTALGLALRGLNE